VAATVIKEAPEGFEPDQPAMLLRAQAIIAAHKGAVAGSRNDIAFKLGARFRDIGLSHAATETSLHSWNFKNDDPLDDAEIAHIAKSVHTYAQNAVGAKSDEPADWSGVAAQVKASASEDGAGEATKAEPEKVPPRFVLRDWQMRRDAKPPEMLIDGLLPDAGTALLYAPRSSYKSFVALDVAVAVATGRPTFGKRRVRRSGPVVYFAGEGVIALEKQRLAALCQHAGIPDSASLPLYTVAGVPLAREPDEASAVVEAIRQKTFEPALIVIDTLARSMGGLNENDAGDAGKFLEMAEAIAAEFHCLVLTVAHEGKDETRGTRGSSAFEAGVDCVWRAQADEKSLTVHLRNEKEKDGESGNSIYLQGCTVAVPGAPRGSLVFREVHEDEYLQAKAAATVKGQQRQSNRDRIEEVLRERGACDWQHSLDKDELVYQLIGADPQSFPGGVNDPDFTKQKAHWTDVLRNGSRSRGTRKDGTPYDAPLCGLFERNYWPVGSALAGGDPVTRWFLFAPTAKVGEEGEVP
jgi:RecA-family ATPase